MQRRPSTCRPLMAALRSELRLEALAEDVFDSVAEMATQICETPVAMITLCDENRTWLKSEPAAGLTADNTVCFYNVITKEISYWPDLLKSPFSSNELVLKQGFRLHAAVPLMDGDTALGCLCVLDFVARTLSPAQLSLLVDMADVAVALLHVRSSFAQLTTKAAHHANTLPGSRPRDLFASLKPLSRPASLEDCTAFAAAAGLATSVVCGSSTTLNCLSRSSSVSDFDDQRKRCADKVIVNPRPRKNSRFFERSDLLQPLQPHPVDSLVCRAFDALSLPCVLADAACNRILYANAAFSTQTACAPLPKTQDWYVPVLVGVDMSRSAAVHIKAAISRRESIMVPASLVQFGKDEPVKLELGVYPLTSDLGELVAVSFVCQPAARPSQQTVDVMQPDAELLRGCLSIICHEMRTPLNGVMALSGLLLETSLNAEQADMAATIRSSADSLQAIITQVLDLSKVEAGRFELEQREFDLMECLDTCIDTIAPFRSKAVELMHQVASDAPARLCADEGCIKQVLLNLLSNAVKFCDKGHVLLETGVARSEGDNVELLFSVSDTGPGIPDDMKERVFEPFAQVDDSATRRQGGIGMGLAVCRAIVKRLDGHIWCEDRPGGGSVFYFTIPVARARSCSPWSSDAAGIDERLLSGLKGAIADLDPMVRTSAESLLARLGISSAPFPQMQCPEWTDDENNVPCTPPQPLPVDTFETPDFVLKGDAAWSSLKRELFPGSSEQLDSSAASPVVRVVDWHSKQQQAGGAAAAQSSEAAVEEIVVCKPLTLRKLRSAVARCVRQSTRRGMAAALSKSSLASGTEVTNGSTSTTDTSSSRASVSSSVAEWAPGAATALFKPKILVVDDNSVNRMVVEKILSKMGHKAQIVCDGCEAVEAYSRNHFDIIFMDLHMPIMNGLEATRVIMEIAAERGVTPPAVSAITADVVPGVRDKCSDAGMCGFISKPFKKEHFEAFLEHVADNDASISGDASAAE